MGENLSVSSPEFDAIEKESGQNTRNAVNLLWAAVNFEIGRRRTEIRIAKEHGQPKVYSVALGANQNDFDLRGAGVLLLTGASARDITGFKAPNPGESYSLLVMVIGAGTITMKHASASSLAGNRLRLQGGIDVGIVTDKCMRFNYLNSLWREEKYA